MHYESRPLRRSAPRRTRRVRYQAASRRFFSGIYRNIPGRGDAAFQLLSADYASISGRFSLGLGFDQITSSQTLSGTVIDLSPDSCSMMHSGNFGYFRRPQIRLQQGYHQTPLVGACTPPPQIPPGYDTSRHLDRIMQSLFVRLRKYRPCQIFGLHIKTMFPQADEMQVTVLG